MNSKTSKGKKNSNTKVDEQETQWTDLANNKAIDEEKKEESEEEDEEFEVELIFDKMIKKGTVYYRVKWKNYSKEDATWEPEANLDNAPLKIREYENQLLAKNNKQPETPKEAPKEAAKEVPKETKPEVSIKAEDEEKDKKEAAKKAVTPKLPVVTEPESVTGKRDRQSLEDDAKKSKPEDKASKAKKEKSGKKTEKSSDKKPTKKKSETQEKSQSDNEEETINKMRKLSPQSSGQPQAQIIPVQDGASKGISGSSTEKNNIPPKAKTASKEAPSQNPTEIQKIEKIYDQIFAQAKQGQTQPTPTPAPEKTNPPSQPMVEEKDSKNNSVAKTPQQSQEMNKGISLSKIMQDEKLMEMSETESQNRSEVQENDKKDQASETAGGSKTKKKGRSEYGALEKGDIPLKVVGIRPVKEDKDLEIMISWKTREDGVKPYNSKVMRIDLLKSGFYMPLIEFYESKMKLEGAPTFDPASLPKV